MARPSKEAIETFMTITGVTESVAIHKLEEHGGDLNEAVDTHFSEGDRTVASRSTFNGTSAPVRQDNFMDFDNPIRDIPFRSPLSLLSAARNMDPFSILGPNFGRGLFDGASDFGAREPFVTHPREVRQIPIEVKDGNETLGQSRDAPTIEDVTDTVDAQGPDVHGTVTINDEDDEDAASGPSANVSLQNERRNFTGNSFPDDDLPEYGDDIEEEMIRAAIEASKKETERNFHKENELSNSNEAAKVAASNDSRFGAERATVLDDDDVEEQPIVQSRTRRRPSTSSEARVHEAIPGPDNEESYPHHSRNPFQSDEWGGISSEEHDEAVMLEAAIFDGLPKEQCHAPYASHPFIQRERSIPRWEPRPPSRPSPSLEAQRLIREQQDDEYLASLKADQEKELKEKAEAEALHSQEEAARKSALEAERQMEEENCRQLEEEKELERQLAAKEATLPQEPQLDDENAITLLVRMPDGSRRGRRFLVSDKLQLLLDFIDIGRIVKPGTYQVVRPFPRRAFSDGESNLTFNELGLTSKQEALFLELK